MELEENILSDLEEEECDSDDSSLTFEGPATEDDC